MKDILALGIGLNREILTTVRLTTGGVCSLVGLDMEESEDCKVCVTESLLLLMHSGFRAARLSFAESEGVCIKIEGDDYAAPAENYPDDEISSALLSALAGDVNMQRRDGRLTAIEFRFAKNGR